MSEEHKMTKQDKLVLTITLAAIFFGARISKKAQLTNWERHDFNSGQALYAATDAWICLEMYRFLDSENLLPENNIWNMPESPLLKL